jgi:hypothetical protein
VVILADERLLVLCVAAPEQKDQPLALPGQCADRRIGETLPAPALVRACLVGPHGQGRVQQQHALVGPFAQVAVIRACDAKVALELCENVP